MRMWNGVLVEGIAAAHAQRLGFGESHVDTCPSSMRQLAVSLDVVISDQPRLVDHQRESPRQKQHVHDHAFIL